uniref:EF-hand domain-containing protein n=1 Tax=Taenia asiatica TaxID=60517 RepID=A0A0R3VWN1_TAEAS
LDKDSKGKLPISSVVQALQLLDQAPTEKVVREIVKKQKLDGGSDGSKYHIISALRGHPRANGTIYRYHLLNVHAAEEIPHRNRTNLPGNPTGSDVSFRVGIGSVEKVLDDRNKGILAADYVSELLLTRGDALTKKQVKVLMSESNAAADGYFAYMKEFGNGSFPPTSVKRCKFTSEVGSNRCCYFSPSEASLNGLQLGTHLENRKNVRFSEQIGFIRIPCGDAREGLVERISGRLKSLCNPRGSTVISGNEAGVHVSSLLCFPKISRRRQSICSIEVAVWNSGRQLRQVITSPMSFKRPSDFPSNFLRGHEGFSLDKWRSQPSLESPNHKHKMRIELPVDSHFDRMESVYVSDLDEDYEWGSTPSEWEGYETPLSILAQKAKVTQVNPCELTNSCSSDEDYEFDEYVKPKNDLQHILKENKCIQCRVINKSPVIAESSDEKWTLSTVTPTRTALQDRVAKSISRLNLPEWIQTKMNDLTETKSTKPSVRLPRFPRYIVTPLDTGVSTFSRLPSITICR